MRSVFWNSHRAILTRAHGDDADAPGRRQPRPAVEEGLPAQPRSLLSYVGAMAGVLVLLVLLLVVGSMF